MMGSGLLLSGGNTAAALLGLVRNIIIARLISVEDFGIASTFAISMAMVEMASNMSLDRLVVQARDGEERHLLSTLHAMQVVRGIIGALVLFFIAGPLASLFGVPEVAWAYQVLAIIPLLRGLAHLDMFRRQREMQFLPSVAVEVGSQLLPTAAALPLALALGDYRAMLCVLLIQQLVFALASHWVAIRPYRWAWNRDIVLRAVRFGWPLLLEGMAIFAILHGDRLIVATLIGMTELGWFSVAFGLAFVPATVATRVLQLYFLPQLSRAQDDPARFARLYLITMQASLLAGVALSVTFALAGPAVLILLYGWKYEPAVHILIWLAIMQSLWMVRNGSSIIAISRASTTTPLIANTARLLALPVALGLVAAGGGIMTLVGVAIAGEGMALGVSLWLLRRRLSLPLVRLGAPLATSLCCFSLVGVGIYVQPAGTGLVQLIAMKGTIVLAGLIALWSMSEFRGWTRAAVQQT
jgi:O-antigen/teichoic acid export membrane protein